MVRSSFDQKPYRKAMIETWGPRSSSPSELTQAGRSILEADPDTRQPRHRHLRGGGWRRPTMTPNTPRLRAQPRPDASDGDRRGGPQAARPGRGDADVIIGCAGSGPTSQVSASLSSGSWPGTWIPWCVPSSRRRRRHLTRELPVRLRGHCGNDAAGEDAPLGHDVPDPIHAGGLRYHGMAPLVSLLKEEGIIEAESLQPGGVWPRAVQFARAEGIIPGPEPAHAVASAMMEAGAGQGGR